MVALLSSDQFISPFALLRVRTANSIVCSRYLVIAMSRGGHQNLIKLAFLKIKNVR